jgi:hypothetical protein
MRGQGAGLDPYGAGSQVPDVSAETPAHAAPAELLAEVLGKPLCDGTADEIRIQAALLARLDLRPVDRATAELVSAARWRRPARAHPIGLPGGRRAMRKPSAARARAQPRRPALRDRYGGLASACVTGWRRRPAWRGRLRRRCAGRPVRAR